MLVLSIGVAMLPGVATLAEVVPGSVEPKHLEQRFQTPRPSGAQPPIMVPSTQGSALPSNADAIRFRPTAIELANVTAFSSDTLLPLYQELLEREASLREIFALADRITAYYGQAGFVLSRAIVPPQTITEGRVRIQVVEGFIDQVLVEGDDHHRPRLFEYFIEKIKASRPLNARILERYLLLANELPGLRVESVMRPSNDTSGAATLVLKVTNQPGNYVLNLDNRGTRPVGPRQTQTEFTTNSLFHTRERLSLGLAATPWDSGELFYRTLSQSHILNGEGIRLDISLSHSKSAPGADMQPMEIRTDSFSSGLLLAWPVLKRRDANLTFTGGLDLRDTRTTLLQTPFTHDRLRIVRIGAMLDRTDALGGNSQLNITFSRGIERLGAQVESRPAAKPTFTQVNYLVSRTQRILDWLSVLVQWSAQHAFTPLPASEQFGFGGEPFGRGFDPSEWTADNGAAQRIEMMIGPWEAMKGKPQLYLFRDHGALRWIFPDPDAPKEISASSKGGGVRLNLGGLGSLGLEWAKPQNSRADPALDRNWRCFARASLSF
ncbi:MAG: ShlB/FhaC/HecB family hemolysin secretion/activation protein [Magnetococcales bacterium]|nr:ShlB/FhaC/HecB family hemolysin secretion/activation protein [Magnetococcales bacterium]